MSKDDVNFVSNTNGMKDNDKVENNSSMLFGGERRTILWLENKAKLWHVWRENEAKISSFTLGQDLDQSLPRQHTWQEHQNKSINDT